MLCHCFDEILSEIWHHPNEIPLIVFQSDEHHKRIHCIVIVSVSELLKV